MRANVILACIAALQASSLDAMNEQFGAAFDAGADEQKASDGTFKQSDLDAAVANAQAIDAQAASDAKSASDAAIKDLSDKLAALATKEGQEAGVIAGLQSSVAAVQGALAAITALLPVPAAALKS